MGRSSTSFKPGQSGNPGGRPKAIAEVRELAQQHTATAIKRLVAILENEKSTDAAAVSAAREVLDRAVGRAEQSISQNMTLRSESAADYKPDYSGIIEKLKADQAAKDAGAVN